MLHLYLVNAVLQSIQSHEPPRRDTAKPFRKVENLLGKQILEAIYLSVLCHDC